MVYMEYIISKSCHRIVKPQLTRFISTKQEQPFLVGIHTHIPECTAFASFRQDVSKVNQNVPHQQRAFPF